MDTKKFVPLVVLLGFVSGLGGSFVNEYLHLGQLAAGKGTAGATQQQTVEQKMYVEESEAIDAIKNAGKSVVSIVASQDLKVYYGQQYPSYSGNDPFFQEFFGDFPGFQQQTPSSPQQDGTAKDGSEKDYKIQRQKIGGGSGFIISEDGLVLTNRHVISEKDVDYTVITNDGAEYEAEVVSVDPFSDIAVLQMVQKGELKKKKEERTALKDLPVIQFGDSSMLEVGQRVLAIGYALGQYENTVTEGIISAKGREITADDMSRGPETLSGLLQTDAAINPGNSGGPLVNLAGQVVGINVAIDATGSSIGFAIPINDVKPALESIKKNGRIIRATLGVRHILLNKAKAKELKIDVDHGALLVGDEANGEFAVIPGSPADKAGLKIKDVVLSVDGKDVTPAYTLQDAIKSKQPGDEVKLKVWRSGQTLDIQVKLDEAKDEASLLRQKA